VGTSGDNYSVKYLKVKFRVGSPEYCPATQEQRHASDYETIVARGDK